MRQLDVNENTVGMLLFRSANAGLAIPGFRHLISGPVQEIAEDLPIVLLILDHKYALAHALPACCSTRKVTVKKNVEPLPSFESARRRPPCISTIRFAM